MCVAGQGVWLVPQPIAALEYGRSIVENAVHQVLREVSVVVKGANSVPTLCD